MQAECSVGPQRVSKSHCWLLVAVPIGGHPTRGLLTVAKRYLLANKQIKTPMNSAIQEANGQEALLETSAFRKPINGEEVLAS